MKNRYGDEYDFVKLDANTYTIKGELNHWRYGGKYTKDGKLDLSDLDFADPSGGPFIGLGGPIMGESIKKISLVDGVLLIKV